ncbi:Six-hairpin glycosidase [Thozetella sp. PMI_491]|nr:Six-hairpin glycosidase [Thozetella sp. PMI_491]
MSATFDRSWIWHPSFTEDRTDTAGLFVHFRREFTIEEEIPESLKVQITADTRYKLYVNHQPVSFGPVKGDHTLWFYDEVDIKPYLKQGRNHVGVHILRFFFSTQHAPSFPRLPIGGLRITLAKADDFWSAKLASNASWETAIDPLATLRVDEPEDVFLHIYEFHRMAEATTLLNWVPAKVLELKNSTGNAPPWNLSPRLIPPYRIERIYFTAIHNLQSSLDLEKWSRLLLKSDQDEGGCNELHILPESKHQLELEIANHTTGFVRVRFRRPKERGGYVKLTYAESYEDEPDLYAGIRRKGHRRDTTKKLLGPYDLYHFRGATNLPVLGYSEHEETEEIFVPFHFRTFRFIRLEIVAGSGSLTFLGIEISSANYPLNVTANFKASPDNGGVEQLWRTSLRTLVNCMHDCYEDCPFYEQMQYAMDTRSSALFTYCVSGEDALARQAIIQIYNSFQPRIGLTTARAPTHKQQFIPPFSLYWILMLNDHLDYFGDMSFLSRFTPVVDAVLSYFGSRVDAELQLVRSEFRPGTWNFVDWTEEWKPYGYPAVCERTGFSTYTNAIYAYALKIAAKLVFELGRPAIAEEYTTRADSIVAGLQKHCFDGEFFTDSLTTVCTSDDGSYSQHSQVWAVLSGAVSGSEAQTLLRKSIQRAKSSQLVQESVSMSFYTMRALSIAGGSIYEEHFHQFWKPWAAQLNQGLTTWVEDSVAQRSDCHAWGSVPLYEYIAEVAGVTPAEPGWKTIDIRPRLNLFPNVDATIPLKMADGMAIGKVHVSWARTEMVTEQSVIVDLRIQMRVYLDQNGRANTGNAT